MSKIHLALLVLIAHGAQCLLASSWEVKSPDGNSFSPARFAISLKAYNAAFITSSFCIINGGEKRSGIPIGYNRELCDKCESCSWKNRAGFTSEIEWETAVTTEMSRLCGHIITPEKQIAGTWIAEAPLSLHTTTTSIGDLASKLGGVSLEDKPVVPETQDRVYYMVSGTPSEVQDLLAAGFSTVTPLPPRLKVDPSLEAAAAADDQILSGGDLLNTAPGGGGRSTGNYQWEEDVGRHLHVQIALPPKKNGGGGGGGGGTSSLYLNASSTAAGLTTPPPGSSAAYLLASTWSRMISSRLGHDKANVMAEGGKHVTVHGLQSSAEWYEVALEIAHHGAVQWVLPQARLMPSNYFARQLVESGGWHVPNAGSGGGVPPGDFNPLSALGLTGKGEVVGIADTGLDWNHCFFKDDRVTPTLRTREEGAGAGYSRFNTWEWSEPAEVWESKTHRKIRQYVAYMNGKEDLNNGHGTHISGSVAGACLDEQNVISRDYSGVAPDAKIAFFDAYSGTKPDAAGICAESFKSALRHAHDVGARVYVASFNEGGGMRYPDGWKMGHHIEDWENGITPLFYSRLAQSIDEYLYSHESSTVLVSAGNIDPSAHQSGPKSTVSRPADAKNVVTVGSHVNPDENTAGEPGSNHRGVLLSVASHSAQGPTHDGRIKPDVCGPGDGIQSAASRVGGVPEQVPRNRPARTLTTSPPHTSDEVALKTWWGGRRRRGRGGRSSSDEEEPATTDDGEAAAGNCGVVVKHGTSSANAIVAGVTVLVRQYFTKGYYPNGVKKWRAGFTPMGALLKAVLVNSGRQLSQPDSDVLEIDDALPNNKMGWGGVDISSTLVTPSSPRGLQLKVFGKAHVSQGKVDVYKIRTTREINGLPLKVTLAWYDKAGTSGSRKALVNDLDLTVMKHGEKNGEDDPTHTYYYSNGKTVYDRTNTVEHITVTNLAPNTKYTIRVEGSFLPSSRQNYGLVISGPFNAKQCTKKRYQMRLDSYGESIMEENNNRLDDEILPEATLVVEPEG